MPLPPSPLRAPGLLRRTLPVLLPLAALALQALLWPWLKPSAWFLFFPAVFFSARLSGPLGGLAATALSAGLAWLCFIEPSAPPGNPAPWITTGLFLLAGFLASLSQTRLERSQSKHAEIRAKARTIERALDEFRKAEKRLRKSEARLQQAHDRFTAALETAPVVVSEQDLELRYTWIHNPALGDRAEEIIGRTEYDLCERAEDAERLTALKCRALETGATQRAAVPLLSQGSLRWYDLAAQPLWTDGAPSGVICAAMDITERKEAEERARRDELRLRLALEAAYLISFEWDIPRDEVRRYMSSDLALATTPENAPVNFASVLEIVHPEDRALFKAQVEAALASADGHYESEFRIVHPDGKVAWLYERGRVERDAQGRPARLIGVSQDFTGRKQAEAALRESEERLKLFIEHAPAALAMFDRDMRYLAASRRWITDYRLEGQPVIGCSHYAVFPELPEDWKAAHRRALAGEVVASEEDYFERQDGTVQWQRWETRPWRAADGSVGGIVIFSEDISRRKQAEVALRQSREDLDRAQEVGRIGWWRLDTQRDVLTWSDQTYRIFGVPKGTPLSYQSFLERVHPDDQQYVVAQWQASLQGKPYDIEHRIVVDGRVKWVRERAYLEFGPDGQLLGGFGITQDISDRKQHEAALRASEDALREADRRKDEFLATLAHELRNPLAPIRSALEVLRRMDGTGEDAKRMRGMMERQVDHLVRLVDDLLEVSRISRGKVELRKQPIDLAEVVQQAVETSLPSIKAGGHTLDIALPGEALRLDADPVRLAQVCANLLNNAAKYTEPGGRIWLKAERQGGEAVVSVRDQGVGIPPEMLPKVFELFAQVDRNLGRAQGGLGIGLALVRSLVELHGGQVEARSEGPGRGSEFIVRLPLADSPAATEAGPDCAAAAITPARILVVDDNQDAADSLGLLLEAIGAEVRVVYAGAQGLLALAEFRPDAVLLDLGMPGMDGFETARRLRLSPEGRAAKLVALTGWGQEEDRRRTREAGFDHHLVKPVGLEELQALLAWLEQAGSPGA